MKLQIKKHAPAAPQRAYPEFSSILKPSFAGSLTFPEDVTRLSLQEVSKYHAQYIALHCYALARSSALKQEILRLESERTFRRNNVIRHVMTYGTRERWKMDRTIETNPDIEKLSAAIAEKQIPREEIEMYVSVFEKYALALSREITRRGTEGRQS